MCRLSGNLLPSAYWNRQGLSRLVKALLYFLLSPGYINNFDFSGILERERERERERETERQRETPMCSFF